MFKWLLPFFIFSSISFALEISIDSAEDNFSKYSTIYIKDKDKFTCQEIKDNLDRTKEIVCAFSKKPFQKMRDLENDFFKVSTLVKNDTFFIRIVPKFKIKLIANIFDLTKDDMFFHSKITLSNSWSIVGYKDKFSLINNKKIKIKNSINFPFFSSKDKFPYIGSLDIKGNPVYIKKVEDVKDYLKIKKYFKEKKYDFCLELIDNVLDRYPNTLFKAELIYYRIKVFNMLKDYDNVIDNSKIYLREYSSDENIPEVLSLMAKAYGNIGLNSDADYFFDRLFSEHQDSIYTYWGYIYKGEMSESSGGEKVAQKFYKKALYGTKDINIALEAAYHLAKLNLPLSSKKAQVYIEKILKIEPSFLMKDFKTSKDMMYEFADRQKYDIASKMAKAILDNITPAYDEYEVILKDLALWKSKTKDKKEAIEYLNSYLKKFPDGDFVNDIQIAKDSLFFELEDMNDTQKIIQYNKLIEEYGSDIIGQKALYEKAKLLLKEKKYDDVLNMQDELLSLDEDTFNDIDKMIREAVIGVMELSLKKNNCKKVLDISSEYNVSLSNEFDDKVYDCAMMGGDYLLSKKIANKHLKSKDIEQRKEWLYRYIKIDFETGNYSEVVDIAKDLIVLVEDDENSKYKDIYRYLFDAYDRLGNSNGMIDVISKIDKIFGLNYKDLDRYKSMVSVGEKLKDNNIIIKYGKKVIELQNRSQSYPQSPYVELSVYQAYMDKNDYENGLKTLKILDNVNLNKNDRAKQKYLMGSLFDKLSMIKEAKKSYEEAIKADANSPWASLAKSALEL